MPKKVLADVDDIVQVKEASNEFCEFAAKLSYDRDDIAALVIRWLEIATERE